MEYENEIKSLMKNYGLYRKEIEVLKATGGNYREREAKLDFLEYCLKLLETYENELIRAIAMNGISIRRYSRATGFSRNFITKERQKIIETINRFFKIKFDS